MAHVPKRKVAAKMAAATNAAPVKRAAGRPRRSAALKPVALEPDALAAHVERASAMLRSMANSRRLLVLCSLVKGEKSVGELQEIVGISQSALSQHLATLRAKRLVAARRETQTIYYRLNGPEVTTVLNTLHTLYCGPDALICGFDAAGI
jgi:ArsR family transcriptional regulator, virulence genes transcriptional regulator